jgi:protocatechuate 3,4-dioxygenase, beta subunit
MEVPIANCPCLQVGIAIPISRIASYRLAVNWSGRCAMIRTVVLATLIAAGNCLVANARDLTPAQTEGPYYPRKKPAETDADLTRIGTGPQARGKVLILNGTITDPDDKPIAGAMVEVWQTDHQGIYAHPGDPTTGKRDTTFQFYGVTTTAETGGFAFHTIMPGGYGGRPRHIHAKITPPGGATLTTQLYFKGDADLKSDGIVTALGSALDRVTLAPTPSEGAGSPLQASITLVVKRGRKG